MKALSSFKNLKTLNYQKITGYLSLLVDILLILLVVLNYLNKLPVFWKTKLTYIFFIILIINTIYLTLKIKNIPEEKRNDSSIVFLSKYFFLLTLIVIAINQFLKREILFLKIF